jgi:hypothetical protein
VLGRSGTMATLLPGASFHGDGRYVPARSLIEAGPQWRWPPTSTRTTLPR